MRTLSGAGESRCTRPVRKPQRKDSWEGAHSRAAILGLNGTFLTRAGVQAKKKANPHRTRQRSTCRRLVTTYPLPPPRPGAVGPPPHPRTKARANRVGGTETCSLRPVPAEAPSQDLWGVQRGQSHRTNKEQQKGHWVSGPPHQEHNRTTQTSQTLALLMGNMPSNPPPKFSTLGYYFRQNAQ